MKIALLSTNHDLGGAAIVTRRLTDALRDAGHDARMIVARPGDMSSAREAVMAVERHRWLPPFLAERAELWIKGTSRKDIFKLSTGRHGAALDRHPFVREADAVMVNWASQGFLSLSSLDRICATGKPVIYTMHDLWPATALCHLPGECSRYADTPPCAACPYFKGRRGSLLRQEIAATKKWVFSHPGLRLVAVSEWQRSMASRSSILKGKEISVIPHPFPATLYQPGEKITPEGKRLIVMAAARLDDPVKDLPAAVDALNTFAWEYPALAADVEVAFAGAIRDDSELRRLRLPWRSLGLLTPDRLRDLYARATIVLSSSKYETMGATLMEGMAAGAIPVSYGDAGQSDIVDDTVNGFLAPRHNPASLAFALSLALQTVLAPDQDGDKTPSLTCDREKFLHNEVTRRFSPAAIAARYLSLLTAAHP